MLQSIWKFELETTDIQTIEMPSESEILCIQIQNGKPCLWVLVLPEYKETKHTKIIEIFGTGHNLPRAKRKYIGTYQLNGGSLVFHCFEQLFLL